MPCMGDDYDENDTPETRAANFCDALERDGFLPPILVAGGPTALKPVEAWLALLPDKNSWRTCMVSDIRADFGGGIGTTAYGFRDITIATAFRKEFAGLIRRDRNHRRDFDLDIAIQEFMAGEKTAVAFFRRRSMAIMEEACGRIDARHPLPPALIPGSDRDNDGPDVPLPGEGHEHRQPAKADFEGRTVVQFEPDADNVWRFRFADGGSLAVQCETSGGIAYMEICDVCAEGTASPEA